jgi:hypothetical protein
MVNLKSLLFLPNIAHLRIGSFLVAHRKRSRIKLAQDI